MTPWVWWVSFSNLSFSALCYVEFFFWGGSGSTSKFIDWNWREKITIFSFSLLTETECLYIANHLEAALEFQYTANQSELAFAFVKDVIPDVMFVYLTWESMHKCSWACFFLSQSKFVESVNKLYWLSHLLFSWRFFFSSHVLKHWNTVAFW